jgi:hypothetical protein
MRDIAFAKYLASIAVTILGALALVVEFRDGATRKITRAGRFTLLGIALGGLALIAIQIVDDLAQRSRETRDLTEKQELQRLVRESRDQALRANYPLRNVEFEYRLVLTGPDSELRAYSQALEKLISANVGLNGSWERQLKLVAKLTA